MADKFNREITFTIREVNGPDVGEPVEFFGSIIGKEEEIGIPYEISASISKSITSQLDTCTINIVNPLVLEDIYSNPDEYLEDFLSRDLILTVFFGYEDFQQVFSGDLIDISVPEGSQLTDQNLIITASSGERAFSRGKLKSRFVAGQTFLDIVTACTDVYLNDYGIEFFIDDPFLKLEKELKIGRTEDRFVHQILEDICRDLDMTWGIDARLDQTTNQKGFFVDKRSVFDHFELFGKGPFEINYMTGALSLPSFGPSDFSFTHRYDPRLNLGAAIDLLVDPQVDSNVPVSGRISNINITGNNKSGQFAYRCKAQFTELVDGELLAKLDSKRKNVGAESL